VRARAAMRAIVLALARVLALATPALALAQHYQDPAVPPAAARAAPRVAPAASGAALQAEVERLIAADFMAADRTGSGRLTRAQARAAGFGYLANHFDAIDRDRRGTVGVDDLLRYLRARRPPR